MPQSTLCGLKKNFFLKKPNKQTHNHDAGKTMHGAEKDLVG